MFRNIFNSDNWLFKPFGWLVDVVCLSVCWCVGAIFILPFGGASAAIYDSVSHCLRRGEQGPYYRFWNTLKENFVTGFIAGIPVLAAGFGIYKLHGVLYALADTGSRQWGMAYVAFWVVMVVVNGILTYFFPMLSRFEFKAGALLLTGFKLAMSHPLLTVLSGLITTAALVLVSVQWLTAFFVPCVWALLVTFPMERVFKPYMGEQE